MVVVVVVVVSCGVFDVSRSGVAVSQTEEEHSASTGHLP